MRLCVIGILAAWLLGTAPAQAADRIALVIGNGAYDALGPLANPANDARLISRTLGRAGFDVTLLIDAEQRAMKRAIRDFGDRLQAAGRDATGLFYFAGHGVQAQGHNFLIPVAAGIRKESDLEIEGVEANWVLRQMEGAGNATNIVILDACRNNPFARSFRSATQGLAQMDAPTGSFVAHATAPGELAYDGDGANSPYSAALARAIEVPGLPIEQMFKQVRINVLQETDGLQTPWDSSSLIGDFYFTPQAPAGNTATDQPEPKVAPPAKPEPEPLARAEPDLPPSRRAEGALTLRIDTEWARTRRQCISPGDLGTITVPLTEGGRALRVASAGSDGGYDYAITAEPAGDGAVVRIQPLTQGTTTRSIEVALPSLDIGTQVTEHSDVKIPNRSRCGGIRAHIEIVR